MNKSEKALLIVKESKKKKIVSELLFSESNKKMPFPQLALKDTSLNNLDVLVEREKGIIKKVTSKEKQIYNATREPLKEKRMANIDKKNYIKNKFKDRKIQRLIDIVDNANAITYFINGLQKDDFFNDDMYQSAVHHRLMNIGVASQRVSYSLVDFDLQRDIDKFSEFRYSGLKAYFSVDKEILWKTITIDLPKLKIKLINLLDNKYSEILDYYDFKRSY